MGKELGCKWTFCEDDAQFNLGVGVTPQRNFRKASSAVSIVRESLQNSIDAVAEYPVRVVFEKRELSIDEYPALFGIEKCTDDQYLENHFLGMKESITQNDAQNLEEYGRKFNYVSSLKQKFIGAKIPYLRISDYNTTGMTYTKEKNTGTFASFVRSLGKNDKPTRGSAGSNGVGKGAYIQLSQYNTLLVSSHSENQKIFEGYMLTVSHYVNGQAYHPFAFYDNNNGKPVCEPSDNSDTNTNIPEEFRRNDIGTDINIIGIDDQNWDTQVEEMTIAVLKNFWLAIYAERMTIEIEGVIINKTTLPNLLKKYFEGKPDGGQERTYNPLPYYNIVSSDESDKIKHIKATLPLLGNVEFYLNKAKTGNGRILYMRESRMLIFSKTEQLYNQINGVFVCTGEEGNAILKEAENEAHNEWKAKVGDKKARNAIKEIEEFIKNCLEKEFGNVTNGTVDIKGLAKRLPITTEPIFDEEYDEEIDIEEDGSTISETIETTDIDIIRSHKERKETGGKVRTRKRNKVTPDPEGEEFDNSLEGDGPDLPSSYEHNKPNGELGEGHGHGNGTSLSDNLDTNTTTPSNENNNGQDKKPVSINSFDSWAFARKIDGEYVYDIRIKCAKEHENANIVIKIGGEAGDDSIDIKESSLGTPDGYTIKGVHLNQGTTAFTLKFKENEKVSLKIGAYEYKD